MCCHTWDGGSNPLWVQAFVTYKKKKKLTQYTLTIKHKQNNITKSGEETCQSVLCIPDIKLSYFICNFIALYTLTLYHFRIILFCSFIILLRGKDLFLVTFAELLIRRAFFATRKCMHDTRNIQLASPTKELRDKNRSLIPLYGDRKLYVFPLPFSSFLIIFYFLKLMLF